MTGLLLAGGRSSRMGVDKASLEFEGEPLAARVARRLGECCDEVLVASGDGERLSWLGLPQVVDAAVNAGPLGGIVAGLDGAPHPIVAVVAVDMPNASPAVLRLLRDAWAGEDAVVPETARGLEPLHAIYSKAAAPVLRKQLDAGVLAVREALELLRVRVLGADEWSAADPTGAFAINFNRPADFA